ncbi:MAG: glycosyltransferase family 4 protein [Candidatus Zixiibacteriota bacterium]
MKIVFLTQYFPPEVGAPQNRLSDLASRLKDKDADITVLTAMPNYPEMVVHEAYRGKWFCREGIAGLDVLRSWIFVSANRKNLLLRLLTYFSFVLSSLVIGTFKLQRFDYIFCESPPLFLGISAYLLKIMKGGRLIFNVSDLWPESAEKLGLITNKTVLSLARRLEEFLYKRSAVICGQTQGIVKSISTRFPDKNIYWLKNGVDLAFFDPSNVNHAWRMSNGYCDNDFVTLYAGILGFAQGLQVILHAAEALKDNDRIKFAIIGSGPEREKLLALKKNLQLMNVRFFDPQPRNAMPGIISACNAGIIPLRRLDLFRGAIPSKIFEFLAMKKPILLGVEGEAKELLVDDGHCGLAFEPENHEDLVEKIEALYQSPEQVANLGQNGYDYVVRNFDRRQIAEDFWSLLRQSSEA